MAKQTTVRLPDDLADDAEAVARVRGDCVNQLIIDALAAEIERVRYDEDFTARAKKLRHLVGMMREQAGTGRTGRHSPMHLGLIHL